MMRIFANFGALKGVPLFSSLTDKQLAAMLPSMQHRSFPARACVLRAGDASDGLHVVVSGRAKLVLEDGEGHEIIVSVLGPNDFFGEIGLLDGSSPLASVHALQPCEIVHVPRKAVLEWLESSPGAAMSMLGAVLGRLAEAQRKIGNLALVDVYGRVARVLQESVHESNGEWLVDIGSEQIAAMVGASREMVSRVVKDMIGRGIVRRRKRKLIVLDRDALFERTRSREIVRDHKKDVARLTARSLA